MWKKKKKKFLPVIPTSLTFPSVNFTQPSEEWKEKNSPSEAPSPLENYVSQSYHLKYILILCILIPTLFTATLTVSLWKGWTESSLITSPSPSSPTATTTSSLRPSRQVAFPAALWEGWKTDLSPNPASSITQSIQSTIPGVLPSSPLTQPQRNRTSNSNIRPLGRYWYLLEYLPSYSIKLEKPQKPQHHLLRKTPPPSAAPEHETRMHVFRDPIRGHDPG